MNLFLKFGKRLPLNACLATQNHFVKTYQIEGNLDSHKIENRRHVRRFESQ